MDAILEFLKQYVIGHTVQTEETVAWIEDGEDVYLDQMSFSNLQRGEDFFSYDLTVVSNEKIYEGSARKKLRKDFSAVSVFRFEFAKRYSSNAFTGVFRYISGNNAGTVRATVSGVYGLQLEEYQLSWKERQLLYRDQPIGDGKYKAVAFDADCRLFVKNGRLHYEYVMHNYDVDPKTLERTPGKDKYPVFLSVEADNGG